MVKLSVSVQNLKTFKGVDKSLFDRFYLGYPYCLEKSGSFMTEPEHLKQAIQELKNLNKEVFLVTPGLMQNSDFEPIEKTINSAVRWGLDGLEIHDVGMLAVASKKWPRLKVLAGAFTNIYNSEAAIEYIKDGATTVLAHPELMFEEIKEISEEVQSAKCNEQSENNGTVPWGLSRGQLKGDCPHTKIRLSPEVGVVVYGSLPLGIAYDCYLKMVEPDGQCRQQCCKPYYFDHAEFMMRNIGKANVMAADFCLLEHIDELIKINASYWRLETYLCDAKKINVIGRAFVDCIHGANPADYIDELKELAPKGLCDGWFHGQSGHAYVGKKTLSKI